MEETDLDMDDPMVSISDPVTDRFVQNHFVQPLYHFHFVHYVRCTISSTAHSSTTILDEMDDFTLTDLLAYDDIEGRLYNDQMVVQFLVSEAIFPDLVATAFRVPVGAIQCRLTHHASIVLSTSCGKIIDACFSRVAFGEQVMKVLRQDEPLHASSSSIIQLVVSSLLRQAPAQTIEMLSGMDGFIERLIWHLDSSSIADLLLQIFYATANTKIRDLLFQWLCGQRLIRQLRASFHVNTNEFRQSNAVYVIVTAIRLFREQAYACISGDASVSAINPDGTYILGDDDGPATPDESMENPLLDELQSVSFADAILTEVLCPEVTTKSEQQRGLVAAMTVLQCLLDTCPPPSEFPDFGQLEVHRRERNDRVFRRRTTLAISGVLKAVLRHWKSVHSLLDDAHPIVRGSPLELSSGESIPQPLGQTRLLIARLTLGILTLNERAPNQRIAHFGTIKALMDLFCRYPNNSLLQTSVAQCIDLMINRPIPVDLKSQPESPLAPHMAPSVSGILNESSGNDTLFGDSDKILDDSQVGFNSAAHFDAECGNILDAVRSDDETVIQSPGKTIGPPVSGAYTHLSDYALDQRLSGDLPNDSNEEIDESDHYVPKLIEEDQSNFDVAVVPQVSLRPPTNNIESTPDRNPSESAPGSCQATPPDSLRIVTESLGGEEEEDPLSSSFEAVLDSSGAEAISCDGDFGNGDPASGTTKTSLLRSPSRKENLSDFLEDQVRRSDSDNDAKLNNESSSRGNSLSPTPQALNETVEIEGVNLNSTVNLNATVDAGNGDREPVPSDKADCTDAEISAKLPDGHLLKYLMSECGVIEWLLDLFTNNSLYFDKMKRRLGYSGHVTALSNEVVSLLDDYDRFQRDEQPDSITPRADEGAPAPLNQTFDAPTADSADSPLLHSTDLDSQPSIDDASATEEDTSPSPTSPSKETDIINDSVVSDSDQQRYPASPTNNSPTDPDEIEPDAVEVEHHGDQGIVVDVVSVSPPQGGRRVKAPSSLVLPPFTMEPVMLPHSGGSLSLESPDEREQRRINATVMHELYMALPNDVREEWMLFVDGALTEFNRRDDQALGVPSSAPIVGYEDDDVNSSSDDDDMYDLNTGSLGRDDSDDITSVRCRRDVSVPIENRDLAMIDCDEDDDVNDGPRVFGSPLYPADENLGATHGADHLGALLAGASSSALEDTMARDGYTLHDRAAMSHLSAPLTEFEKPDQPAPIDHDQQTQALDEALHGTAMLSRQLGSYDESESTVDGVEMMTHVSASSGGYIVTPSDQAFHYTNAGFVDEPRYDQPDEVTMSIRADIDRVLQDIQSFGDDMRRDSDPAPVSVHDADESGLLTDSADVFSDFANVCEQFDEEGDPAYQAKLSVESGSMFARAPVCVLEDGEEDDEVVADERAGHQGDERIEDLNALKQACFDEDVFDQVSDKFDEMAEQMKDLESLKRFTAAADEDSDDECGDGVSLFSALVVAQPELEQDMIDQPIEHVECLSDDQSSDEELTDDEILARQKKAIEKSDSFDYSPDEPTNQRSAAGEPSLATLQSLAAGDGPSSSEAMQVALGAAGSDEALAFSSKIGDRRSNYLVTSDIFEKMTESYESVVRNKIGDGTYDETYSAHAGNIEQNSSPLGASVCEDDARRVTTPNSILLLDTSLGSESNASQEPLTPQFEHDERTAAEMKISDPDLTSQLGPISSETASDSATESSLLSADGGTNSRHISSEHYAEAMPSTEILGSPQSAPDDTYPSEPCTSSSHIQPAALDDAHPSADLPELESQSKASSDESGIFEEDLNGEKPVQAEPSEDSVPGVEMARSVKIEFDDKEAWHGDYTLKPKESYVTHSLPGTLTKDVTSVDTCTCFQMRDASTQHSQSRLLSASLPDVVTEHLPKGRKLLDSATIELHECQLAPNLQCAKHGIVEARQSLIHEYPAGAFSGKRVQAGEVPTHTALTVKEGAPAELSDVSMSHIASESSKETIDHHESPGVKSPPRMEQVSTVDVVPVAQASSVEIRTDIASVQRRAASSEDAVSMGARSPKTSRAKPKLPPKPKVPPKPSVSRPTMASAAKSPSSIRSQRSTAAKVPSPPSSSRKVVKNSSPSSLASKSTAAAPASKSASSPALKSTSSSSLISDPRVPTKSNVNNTSSAKVSTSRSPPSVAKVSRKDSAHTKLPPAVQRSTKPMIKLRNPAALGFAGNTQSSPQQTPKAASVNKQPPPKPVPRTAPKPKLDNAHQPRSASTKSPRPPPLQTSPASRVMQAVESRIAGQASPGTPSLATPDNSKRSSHASPASFSDTSPSPRQHVTTTPRTPREASIAIMDAVECAVARDPTMDPDTEDALAIELTKQKVSVAALTRRFSLRDPHNRDLTPRVVRKLPDITHRFERCASPRPRSSTSPERTAAALGQYSSVSVSALAQAGVLPLHSHQSGSAARIRSTSTSALPPEMAHAEARSAAKLRNRLSVEESDLVARGYSRAPTLERIESSEPSAEAGAPTQESALTEVAKPQEQPCRVKVKSLADRFAENVEKSKQVRKSYNPFGSDDEQDDDAASEALRNHFSGLSVGATNSLPRPAKKPTLQCLGPDANVLPFSPSVLSKRDSLSGLDEEQLKRIEQLAEQKRHERASRHSADVTTTSS